jgi:hypothetical protein
MMGSPWRLVPSPPVAGGLAVGAGDLLVVPVDAEPAEVQATLVAGLPATVGRQRTDQLDAVVGASVKHTVHADIGRVDQMLVWQQAHAGEVGVASWHGIHVGGGGHRGRHVHDQVGPVGLAGLGEVGLVATGSPPHV